MKTDLFDYSKQHWLWIQHTSGVECNISEIFQIEGGLVFKDIWWRTPEEQPMHIIRGAITRYNVEPDTWIVLMDADPGGFAFIRRLTRSKKLLWDERRAWEGARRSAVLKWGHYTGSRVDFCKQIRFAIEGSWCR